MINPLFSLCFFPPFLPLSAAFPSLYHFLISFFLIPTLFSNILFPLPSFPASRLSPPPPPPHSANICGVQCKPPGGALGMHSAPWLARDVQPSGRWPCEQPPCKLMCVVGEGCARGRGDVGEAPRSLCWGESVTTKKNLLAVELSPYGEFGILRFHLPFYCSTLLFIFKNSWEIS